MTTHRVTGYRLRPTIVTPLLSVAMFLTLGMSHAASAAGLPGNIRTSPNVAGNLAQIDTFVKSQIDALANPGAGASRAREALVQEAKASTDPQAGDPSQQFLRAYCQSIATAITPLLTNSDVRVRLNCAVAIANVAEACDAKMADDTPLVPAIITLLNDKHEAVLVWALRGAQHTLYSDLTSRLALNQKSTLLAQISTTASSHISSAMIVDAAYDALAMKKGSLSGQQLSAALAPVVDAIIQLMQQRVAEYAQQLPAEASVETGAMAYLTQKDVFTNVPPETQLAALQAIFDVLGSAAQRAPAVTSDDYQEIIALMVGGGKSLWVVGFNTDKTELQRVSERPNVNKATRPEQLVDLVAGVRETFAKSFPGLKPPPTIQVANAAATDPGAHDNATKPAARP